MYQPVRQQPQLPLGPADLQLAHEQNNFHRSTLGSQSIRRKLSVDAETPLSRRKSCAQIASMHTILAMIVRKFDSPLQVMHWHAEGCRAGGHQGTNSNPPIALLDRPVKIAPSMPPLALRRNAPVQGDAHPQ
jgi:hypothetical protein